MNIYRSVPTQTIRKAVKTQIKWSKNFFTQNIVVWMSGHPEMLLYLMTYSTCSDEFLVTWYCFLQLIIFLIQKYMLLLCCYILLSLWYGHYQLHQLFPNFNFCGQCIHCFVFFWFSQEGVLLFCFVFVVIFFYYYYFLILNENLLPLKRTL